MWRTNRLSAAEAVKSPSGVHAQLMIRSARNELMGAGSCRYAGVDVHAMWDRQTDRRTVEHNAVRVARAAYINIMFASIGHLPTFYTY